MSGFLTQSSYFGICLSIGIYLFFVLLKKRFPKLPVNPLLCAILSVIAVLVVFRIDYDVYNQSAKYLTYLLTPATICLAIPFYEQEEKIRENLLPVLGGIVAGVLANAALIAAFSIAFSLGHEVFVTLLPKSLTAAISIVLSSEYGGRPDITIIATIIAGQTGSLLAPWLYRVLRIDDPLARGVGLGTAAHAVGTARAMDMDELSGAASSFSMVMTGILSVMILPAFIHLI